MEVDIRVVLPLVVFGAGICGTIISIYVSQQRDNAKQEEKNANIAERLTKLEKESDEHRDKFNDMLLTMNDKINKIYNLVVNQKKN